MRKNRIAAAVRGLLSGGGIEKPVPQLVTTFRGYELDPFQIEAISYIDAGESVLVSAPTGTGKTLIADYVIEKMYQSGRRVVYTAPIKALSNQKFKEFKRLLGPDPVGILTGDVVINPDAAIVIMTTEVFRNLLHADPDRVADVAYVIFDEIHYIDDPARGAVWEESIIFMPPSMRLLGLSATIPNVDELASWVAQLHGHPVRVVQHGQRAVPLVHQVYERAMGFGTLRQLHSRFWRYARRFGRTETGRLATELPPTTHLDLLEQLTPEDLPCLFFTFSRRRCELHATELASRHDYLNAEEKERVAEVIQRQLERYGGAGASRLGTLEPLLLRGVGYHHAGLLPLVKDIVEELFESRLLYVLYCTETFAVGLNFPCKTVAFDGLTKWDGEQFRPLTNREYFQMAGRAGRRGIDPVGYVYAVIDLNFFNPDGFPSLREEDVEPLRSRFTLTYNTVLNLVAHYEDSEIEEILAKNFATFQARRQRESIEARIERVTAELRSGAHRADGVVAGGAGAATNPWRQESERRWQRRQARLARQVKELRRQLRQIQPEAAYRAEFAAKRELLEALDFIRGRELTARGEFAARVNVQELLLTELYFDGVFHDWSVDEINGLAVAIDYEPRKAESRPPMAPFDLPRVRRIAIYLEQAEEAFLRHSSVRMNHHLSLAAFKWSRGARLADILIGLDVDEGDAVYALRRAIDVLRQVRQAAREDEYLAAKLSEAIARMDRDEVSILL